MTKTMIALAAAALTAPGLAVAAPAPLAANGIPVDPNRHVEGTFQAPGTQGWRVYLRQGRHYALYGQSDPTFSVVIRAAGGKVLGSFPIFDSTGDNEGADFTAPYTGLYAVTVTAGPACSGDTTPCTRTFPSTYSLSAALDCAGDPSTRCGIAPGETLRGLNLSFIPTTGPGDEDWFRTSLVAGLRYVASLAAMDAEAGCVFLGFRDARGGPVGNEQEECRDDSGAGQLPVAITAPTSGAYFVVVRPGDETTPSTYDLALSR